MAKTESIQCPSMRIQEIFLIETNFYSVKTPKSQIVSFLSWQTQLFLVASLKQDHLVQMNTTIKFCFSTKFKNFSERNRNQIWLNLLKKRKVWSQCSQARRGLLKVSHTHTLCSLKNLTLSFTTNRGKSTITDKTTLTKSLWLTRWLWICMTKTGRNTCVKLFTYFGCRFSVEYCPLTANTRVSWCFSLVN